MLPPVNPGIPPQPDPPGCGGMPEKDHVMATYSDHEQRELDAASFAEDDKRRAAAAARQTTKPTPSPPARRPRFPTVTVPQKTVLDDDIQEAMSDAICDGEGRSNAFYLRHHLAKCGLVIVEASRLGRMKVALQLIGSATVELAKMEP